MSRTKKDRKQPQANASNPGKYDLLMEDLEDGETMVIEEKKVDDSDRDTESDFEEDGGNKKGRFEIPPEAEQSIRHEAKNRRKMFAISSESMVTRKAKTSNSTGKDLVKIAVETKDASVVTAGLIPFVKDAKTKKPVVMNPDAYIEARKTKGIQKDVTAYEFFGTGVKLTVEVAKNLGIFAGQPDSTMKRVIPIFWRLVRKYHDDDEFLELWRNPLQDDGESVKEAGWYQLFRKYNKDIAVINAVMDEEHADRLASKLSKVNVSA